MIGDGDCGGMKIGRGNPALVPLCPPQIPHDYSGFEPGPLRWEASDYLLELWRSLSVAIYYWQLNSLSSNLCDLWCPIYNWLIPINDSCYVDAACTMRKTQLPYCCVVWTTQKTLIWLHGTDHIENTHVAWRRTHKNSSTVALLATCVAGMFTKLLPSNVLSKSVNMCVHVHVGVRGYVHTYVPMGYWDRKSVV
jgi:hypothetical protein